MNKKINYHFNNVLQIQNYHKRHRRCISRVVFFLELQNEKNQIFKYSEIQLFHVTAIVLLVEDIYGCVVLGIKSESLP